MSVLPVELAVVLSGETVFVPEPSAAKTVTLGSAAMAVKLDVATDRWRVAKVFAPVVLLAVAPVPPLAVLP